MTQVLSTSGSADTITGKIAVADAVFVRHQQASSEMSLTFDIQLKQGVSNGRIRGTRSITTERVPILPQTRFMLYVITSFAPERYEVLSEIPVVVREIGDERDNYVARFADANVNASGDSADEAFANLKSALLSKFEYFSSVPKQKLGPEPRRQLAVLKSFIRRKR